MDLPSKLNKLSPLPGIYQMLDAQGKVLYVGKAKNLKKRVSSYFKKNIADRKTQALMEQVSDFTVTITQSEDEALLLEANLIKQFRPRYNILLRDDKSYPYLYLSTNQKFPRLDFHRGAKNKPGRYFGPYPSAGAVRDNLALIQKLFKVRQCSDPFFKNRTRPCLQYQIKRCTAPCVGYVSEKDYAKQVENTILFLEGKNEAIMQRLTEQMNTASTDLDYEQAAFYRDLIIRFRKLQTEQCITGGEGDIDIIGVAKEQGQVAIAVLFVRGGRVIGHKTFLPKTPADIDIKTALSEFIPQYYLSPLRGDVLVNRIILSESIEDKDWLQNGLNAALAKKIIITDRKLAKYKQWQRMALINANYALTQHLSAKDNIGIKLEALQKELQMPNPIQRIECFDVSHTMGEATVASCVVYDTDGPKNQNYRRYNIKSITPGDDYAALHQALTRRYTRMKESNAPLPDLIIIDGGKGQLQQAANVLEELQVSGVVLMGIAKGPSRKPGLEELFIYGHTGALQLKPDSLALHLLQFIRDEAHRFAITAHRNQRGKKRKRSTLEDIPGVGAKRRRALLQHFGGLQQLTQASANEIAKVSGISEQLAQKIYDYFHE
jgi:excinuclease ABC subunit C